MDFDAKQQQRHQNQSEEVEEREMTIKEDDQQSHQNDEGENNSNRFDQEIIEENTTTGDPTDDILIDIDGDDLLFSDDAFSSLPDFACLSSPSPSSASNLSVVPSMSSTSSSSSNSSSWPFVSASGPLQDQEQRMQMEMLPAATAVAANSEAIATTDIFGEIELWDPSHPLDQSFLFPGDYGTAIQEQPRPPHCVDGLDEADEDLKEEMGKIYQDWLNSNKSFVSQEDLKSIKLKRATIECAAARLGHGKEGKTRLLKLILMWVQNHHCQKKKRRLAHGDDPQETSSVTHFPCYGHVPQQLQFVPGEQNPNPSCALNYSYEQQPWPMHYPVENLMPVSALPGISETPMYPNAGVAPYHQYYQNAVTSSTVVNSQPFSPSADLSHAFPPPSVQYPAVAPSNSPHPKPYVGGYPSSSFSMYPSPTLSSATKEARKKRMARQRRFSALHQHRNRNQRSSEKLTQKQVATEGGSSSSAARSNANSRDWAFLPPATHAAAPPVIASNKKQQLPLKQMRNESAASDKQQDGKPEKNMRFLLQKVLKQSDVGSLGRIVLPKKEAEVHLPELDSRDGISIEMEDIGTSQTWNMKYRFWPNNKSRMYLLENTGDFVRANGLQEGDFIVIYSDVKCNKYMIRGVKVRQPAELAKGAAGSRMNAAKGRQGKAGFNATRRSKGTSRASEVSHYLEENENDVAELPSCSEEDEDA